MKADVGKDKGSFTFTVGKLDAGMAILIGSRAHLIEFPSILLPDGVTVGSIVNIDVHRNVTEEEQQKAAFWELQNVIYTTYGIEKPVAPVLKLRHVTQTSVTLEWPALQLATASLRSLDIYRSGQRLASIPNPLSNTSTKLSGLQMASPYTFQLILRTTAGTFPSNIIEVKTHTIEDTSGISVCFGTILDSDVGNGVEGAGAERKEELKRILDAMGAKYSDKIQIDTTHFVCTTSLSLTSVSRNTAGGPSSSHGQMDEPGVEYQKALQLSIPIVQPDWVFACYYGKKMVPTAPYYLGATVPPLAQGHARVQSISQQSQPLPPTTPTTSTSQRPSSSTTRLPPTSGASRGAPSGTPPKTAASSREPNTARPYGTPSIEGQRGFINTGSEPNSANPTIPPSTARSDTSNKGGKVNAIEPPPPSLPITSDSLGSDEEESPTTPSGSRRDSNARQRTGTMNKAFKFPPGGGGGGGNKSPGLTISPPPNVPPVPPIIIVHEAKDSVASMKGVAAKGEVKRVMPEPPTPDLTNPAGGSIMGRGRSDSDVDIGETVEVDLS
ncbi:hypothetical protein CPB86DRAFT_502542 [Serendipita vermifera]|nr:hypothetical protein CPB86DRAFT_502542 [Serendipita vermifera]